jgi:hypothetical protein
MGVEQSSDADAADVCLSEMFAVADVIVKVVVVTVAAAAWVVAAAEERKSAPRSLIVDSRAVLRR